MWPETTSCPTSSNLTRLRNDEAAATLGRPIRDAEQTGNLHIRENNIKTLNVAGIRGSRSLWADEICRSCQRTIPPAGNERTVLPRAVIKAHDVGGERSGVSAMR